MRAIAIIAALLLAGSALITLTVPLCGCSTKTGFYASSMRSDLKNLAVAQESYFADHGAYATDLSALEYQWTRDVTVEILHADANGWIGRASHSGFSTGSYRGVDCVAAVGDGQSVPRTTMKHRSPTADRAVVCDLDGWRAIQSRWGRWRWKISD